MLQTVLLDLDDTLLDFTKAERVALSKTLLQLGLEPTDAILSRYHAINRSQWELLERGELTREQVLYRRFELLFDEHGIRCAAQDAKTLYEHFLGEGHYFIPHAPETLQLLSERYHLYLMTNGTASIQRRRLQSAGIIPYFDGIFISQEVGFNKPDTRYFEYCFAAIPHFEKEKAVMIGDSLSSDILGGNRAGIRTCWFNSTHAAPTALATPDFEVDSLTALPALLETL